MASPVEGGGGIWASMQSAMFGSSLIQDLWEALESDDVDRFRASMARGIKIDLNGAGKERYRLYRQYTLLLRAIQKQNNAIVEILLRGGADPNLSIQYITDYGSTCYSDTPLLAAIRAHQVEMVHALIRAGADVNLSSKEGNNSPLACAAYAGEVEMVDALIRAGADINFSDPYGSTPLSTAAYSGEVEILNALIRAGADIGRCSKLCLMGAVNHQKVEMINALISLGAKVNDDAERGWSILGKAVHLAASTSDRGASLDVVDALIRAGADVKELIRADVPDRDKTLFNMLGQAVSWDNGHIIDILIQAGVPLVPTADISTVDNSGCKGTLGFHRGYNLLTYAIQEKKSEAVEALVRAGFPTAAPDSNGNVPIAMAINSATDESLALIRLGIDLNCHIKLRLFGTAYDSHLTPLTVAILWDKPAAVHALIKAGADVNLSDENHIPLILAISYNRQAIISALLQAGADVNLSDKSGKIPLMAACENHNHKARRETLDILIHTGAKVNLTATNGYTPLTWVLERCWDSVRKDAFGELLRAGADVNLVDTEGYTPLTRAMIEGRSSSSLFCDNEARVTHLIQAGARVNLLDGKGKTPLTAALSQKQSLAVLELLIREGADVTLEDGLGNAPLTAVYAMQAGRAGSNYNIEAWSRLLRAGAQLNQIDKSGSAVLHLAAKHDDEKAVKYLLGCGADKKLKDRWDKTAAFYAQVAPTHNEKLISMLFFEEHGERERDASSTEAAHLEGAGGVKGTLDDVHRLVKDMHSMQVAGAISAYDSLSLEERIRLTIDAASRGDTDEVMHALGEGVSLETANSEGKTLLMLAAEQGHLELVRRLVAAGANKEAETASCQTALMLSAAKKHIDVVRVLVG